MPDVSSTLAERASTHGDFNVSARTVQTLKRTMRTTPGWEHLSDAQKEALEMIQHKIGRVLHGQPNHADTWHDIAGYSVLIERALNEAQS